jgi:glycerol uptake facilitator protein
MLTSPFLGELMGTMILLLLGDGVVANVVLKQTKAHASGWMVITTAWGLAVIMGIFVAQAFGSPDAHINPAVTLAFAIISGDYSNVASFVTAQTIGAFLGAVLVWLHHLPHWKVTEDPADKLGCFATAPAIRDTTSNLIGEAIGTIVLIIGLVAMSKTENMPAGVGPYLVGMLVWGIGLSLGGTTGYAINPARDLGPRIAHAVLPIPGKGSSDWGYAWIPVVGPFLGGAIAALFLGLFAL